MIGQTISHYKILEKLGEGGMGVVYKAEDTKLKRTVALKFLPQGLETHEPERARLLQEAQAAATLNHPNICTIHDISEQQDQQFIVMEYVDGQTLRKMIPKLQEALGFAIQIGEALQEAHSKGVIHRDIKTDNIMVNSRNQVKVMDFGLAKLKGSLKLTKTSTTVGTLAYMAPEQIHGGEVDARSDIFSFGIVLYEMLTGRLPFQGEYEAALMFSILNESPEPMQKYRSDLPSGLLHIVNRALEKNPEDRYQSIQEIVIELKRVKKETSGVFHLPVTPLKIGGERGVDSKEQKAATTVRRKKLLRAVLLAGLVSALMLIVVITLLTVWSTRVPRLNPDMSFRTLPIPFIEIGYPGLSYDGNWAAFPAADPNGKWEVYFMNTTSGESRCITSDSSMYMNKADISPNGSQVVYDRANLSSRQMDLAIVSSVGGLSRKIVDGGILAQWRPDGQRIGYIKWSGIRSPSGKAEFWTVKPNGTDNRCELVDSVSEIPKMFAWSPDGESICWIRNYSDKYQEILLYDLTTKKARQLTFDQKKITDVCWTYNDQIIFTSNRRGNMNLWMMPVSGSSLTQITTGTGPDKAVKISRDGSKLLYYQMQLVCHLWVAGIPGNNPHQITFDDAEISNITFSPDRKEVLFTLTQPVGQKKGSVLCAIDRDGKNRKQLTTGDEIISNLLPSPTGQWIIYSRQSLEEPEDSSQIYIIDRKNPGIPRMVDNGVPLCWIDDRMFIRHDYTKSGNWLTSIDGGESKKISNDSSWAIPLQGGKYIGYYSRQLKPEGIWIRAAAGVQDPDLPSPKLMAPFPPYYGKFDNSGKYFYLVKNEGELRRISIPSGKEEIIPGRFPGLGSSIFADFEVSYDDKEIVYTDARGNSKLVMIENLFK
jgi:serine/threonine protein kinase